MGEKKTKRVKRSRNRRKTKRNGIQSFDKDNGYKAVRDKKLKYLVKQAQELKLGYGD